MNREAIKSRPATNLALALLLWGAPLSANEVWKETRADVAFDRYGATGKGVVVVVLDRGINPANPDFRNPDGSTRIKYLLDMSQQTNWCNQNPVPPVTELTAAQINAALAAGGPLPARDAVGHGDATTGAAAGNGRAAAGGKYRGIAPDADLIVVKMTSEGAPAHGSQPAESGFNSCFDQALEWVATKLDALGQPAVLIINSGTQFGPIDGTSATSRKLQQVFPSNRPGRIAVVAGGAEGGLPNHAGGAYSSTLPAEVRFRRQSTVTSITSIWYDGNRPAEVTVSLDGGETLGPVAPGSTDSSSKIRVFHYRPGEEFYPWRSTSGGHSVWIELKDHQGNGTIKLTGTTVGQGRFDAYGDLLGANLKPTTEFLDHLVPGRLTDHASTPTAIVVGNHVLQTMWVDVDGIAREILDQGSPGELWSQSPSGPTRDGRIYGIDLTSPGQQSFASTTRGASYWSTLRGNLSQEGEGWYTRFGSTSGATPIVVGAIARMLELDPTLTTEQARRHLRASARSDVYTGAVPNPQWGYGKLDVNGALDQVACEAGLGLCLNQSRFLVRVTWRDFHNRTGRGQLVPFGSDDSGLLYFFDPDNWEMLLKVLNGCGINNHFWVFSAATTNVEYTLEVTDLLTGAVKKYFNPLGNAAAAITDSNAFATCDAQPKAGLEPVASSLETKRSPRRSRLAAVSGAQAGVNCTADGTTLCLNQGRFRVEVEWRDFAGNTGSGKVVPFGSADSGLYYFFTPDNWEMLVKVLNGCPINNNFWVLAAATTNVQYTLTVTDTQTNRATEYFNPLGLSAPAITDTSALTCS